MPKRADANQSQIVKDLRDVGASVAVTHTLGHGFGDLVVGFRGVNYLFEVKDENKPPSKRKLTRDEVEFHQNWRGQIDVVKNSHEALAIIGAV